MFYLETVSQALTAMDERTQAAINEADVRCLYFSFLIVILGCTRGIIDTFQLSVWFAFVIV